MFLCRWLKACLLIRSLSQAPLTETCHLHYHFTLFSLSPPTRHASILKNLWRTFKWDIWTVDKWLHSSNSTVYAYVRRVWQAGVDISVGRKREKTQHTTQVASGEGWDNVEGAVPPLRQTMGWEGGGHETALAPPSALPLPCLYHAAHPHHNVPNRR